ncbi:hypothetical protein PL9631_110035 [Planktothrix paucivesiculata PCC 9631]|uniref:Uncharacterized protein n=1 Tax=Planktothrix paucivesiculata PCC 9631 TaxID=671071 RepID=A0A7Z9BI64_9CYAN|nr:hypothetical protein PL9631_110035 [Planktothrix paucivesiculata PCC 9631]
MIPLVQVLTGLGDYLLTPIVGFRSEGILRLRSVTREQGIEIIALRITVRTLLSSETLSLLTVPCSLFPSAIVRIFSQRGRWHCS